MVQFCTQYVVVGRRAPCTTLLYFQESLGREIVLAGELDLHLIWAKSRIFIKPLNFLLNFEFWRARVSCSPRLHQAWMEFVWTILPVLNPQDHRIMDVRFQYGELRLNRLDTITDTLLKSSPRSTSSKGFPIHQPKVTYHVLNSTTMLCQPLVSSLLSCQAWT